MNEFQPSEYNKQVYYRLIALWVICEAFAGGIMHGIKVPFSGLIVSSLAIACIILIAWYVPYNSAIIKATIIVAIFKLLLSPHSPPTAYIAVFFQGLMGQLLLKKGRYFNLAAVIVAIFGLVESAIQRILVLMIVYGDEFWKAVNVFIQKLIKEKETTNYSLAIAAAYIFFHALIGFFVGIYAVKLARDSGRWPTKYPELLMEKREVDSAAVGQKTSRRKKIKIIFLVAWLSLILLYLQAYFDPRASIIPSNTVVQIIARSVFILLSWYLVLSPLVMLTIQRLLHSQQGRYRKEIDVVITLIPQTRYIFKEAFLLSKNEKGMSRIKLFLKILLINVLADQPLEHASRKQTNI